MSWHMTGHVCIVRMKMWLRFCGFITTDLFQSQISHSCTEHNCSFMCHVQCTFDVVWAGSYKHKFHWFSIIKALCTTRLLQTHSLLHGMSSLIKAWSSSQQVNRTLNRQKQNCARGKCLFASAETPWPWTITNVESLMCATGGISVFVDGSIS